MIPDGLVVRPATVADAAAATAVVNAMNRAFLGDEYDDESVEDTLGWWASCDMERETRVVLDGDELVGVGVLDFAHDEGFIDAYVAPGWTGRGIDTAFAAWGEEQARARGRSAVRAGYLVLDTASERLFRERGYAYVRSFYRMLVDLDGPPAEPEWPTGCAVSVGDERDVHAVLDAAFANHWSYLSRPFEQWITQVQAEHPDPELWLVVRVDGELGAATICGHRFGMGWIGLVGVLPGQRRRGLGRALLLHSIAELYARGERRLGLGVDATNETGAVRLYESIGMRVAARVDFVERRL